MNAWVQDKDSYVATPNGSLFHYDRKSGEERVVSTEMPSDENHHSKRKNDIDSKPLPKDEPTRTMKEAVLTFLSNIFSDRE